MSLNYKTNRNLTFKAKCAKMLEPSKKITIELQWCYWTNQNYPIEEDSLKVKLLNQWIMHY